MAAQKRHTKTKPMTTLYSCSVSEAPTETRNRYTAVAVSLRCCTAMVYQRALANLCRRYLVVAESFDSFSRYIYLGLVNESWQNKASEYVAT